MDDMTNSTTSSKHNCMFVLKKNKYLIYIYHDTDFICMKLAIGTSQNGTIKGVPFGIGYCIK